MNAVYATKLTVYLFKIGLAIQVVNVLVPCRTRPFVGRAHHGAAGGRFLCLFKIRAGKEQDGDGYYMAINNLQHAMLTIHHYIVV